MALKEPVGVIPGIAPWNAPIILGVRAIAVPLACGNSVILKASELCPRTHALIIEAFAEAGFPEGVVNVVTNAPEDAAEVVGALIDAPEVKRINFTGSTNVGRIIAKRAATPGRSVRRYCGSPRYSPRSSASSRQTDRDLRRERRVPRHASRVR